MLRPCSLLLVWAAFAQTLSFEVASIKPSPPMTPELMRSGQMHLGAKIDKARADFGGLPLTDYVARAFRVKSYQVSGPDDLKLRFDIMAKMPDGATEDQVPDMLQTLLVERFGLKFHRETKEFPVYALVVGKTGPKLTPKPADYDPKAQSMVRPQTMEGFAQMLSNLADRPVVDQTEIKGEYMISLDFLMQGLMNRARSMARQQAPPSADGNPADSASDPSDSGPFGAAQKYGLKLEPKKLPMSHIIVDQISKTPTEN